MSWSYESRLNNILEATRETLFEEQRANDKLRIELADARDELHKLKKIISDNKTIKKHSAVVVGLRRQFSKIEKKLMDSNDKVLDLKNAVSCANDERKQLESILQLSNVEIHNLKEERIKLIKEIAKLNIANATGISKINTTAVEIKSKKKNHSSDTQTQPPSPELERKKHIFFTYFRKKHPSATEAEIEQSWHARMNAKEIEV